MPNPDLHLEDLNHPREALLKTYRGELRARSGPVKPTGETRAGYLTLIEPVVRFFLARQDERGAIIDPVFEREWHYSTPCFALGAAVLASAGKSEFTGPAVRAMLHACEALASGQAPDNHPDFFTIFLIKADGLLRPLAEPAARKRWQAALRRIDPAQIYRAQLGRLPENHIHNWNAINLTGEFLRYQAGLGGDPAWWAQYLPYHLRRFTPDGLYRDGDPAGTSHPLAYDAVTRYHLSAMLDGGYAGEFAGQIDEMLLRGALTSLFLQSPNGEWPGAGRSAHHTWNDATIAVAYEYAARRLSAREPELAAACKRGAHLALQAMRPWLRPGGDLNILRNHFEPEERHGFESYSIHTTYNLWAAAALSVAYILADEANQEAALPSECLPYALDLGPDFHQIAAGNRGFYLLIDGCGDPNYNPTGLVRINRAGCNPQIGPSEGAVSTPHYSALGPKAALAHAPAWKDRLGAWHSLADYGSNRGSLSPTWRMKAGEESGELRLEVAWRGALDGCSAVHAVYHLAPAGVRIRYTLDGTLKGLRAEIPLFDFDGAEQAQIEEQDGAVLVRFRGSQETVRLMTPGARLVVSEERAATRTGLLRKAWAEVAGSEIEIEVTLQPEAS